jgi:hypothetical protein
MSETLRTVSPKSAVSAIKTAIKVKRPIMLHGAPGIGKSDIMHQIGADSNRPVIDIRLALYDPSDLKGFPYFDPNTKTMKWAQSSELPTGEFSNAIIFLDELVSAAPSVQAAAYQLVLNRKIGEYNLPEGVDIVAAGNRASDRGVVYKMPAPLANRFVHLELKVDVDEWIEWAANKGLHKDVVGYISHAKQDLFTFDPKSSGHAFATPRTWEFVSQILAMEDEIGEETALDLISGTIGDGLAIKHSAFRKHAAKLPKAMDVLTGLITEVKTKEVGALYSLVISLAYELRELHQKKHPKFWQYMDTAFDFQMKNMQVELNIMSAKTLLKTFGVPIEPDKMKNFDKFYEKFGKYIFATV